MEVGGCIGQIANFNPLGAAIAGAVAGTFLMMWFEDSEDKRKWFFYTYTAATLLMILAILLVITGIIGGGTALDIDVIAEKTCKGMSA